MMAGPAPFCGYRSRNALGILAVVAVEVLVPRLLSVELGAVAKVEKRHRKGPVRVHLLHMRHEIQTCLTSQLPSATS